MAAKNVINLILVLTIWWTSDRLDLMDRVPDELWTEVHDIVQEKMIKTIPKKKKCNKAKRLSKEVLKIAEKKLKAKEKGKNILI